MPFVLSRFIINLCPLLGEDRQAAGDFEVGASGQSGKSEGERWVGYWKAGDVLYFSRASAYSTLTSEPHGG